MELPIACSRINPTSGWIKRISKGQEVIWNGLIQPQVGSKIEHTSQGQPAYHSAASKMFSFFSCMKATPPAAQAQLPIYPPHMGAGCVFTDGKHILAGYQPHKKRPGITGIGGHKEGEETYLETAYRETLEELFHVEQKQIPIGLVPKLVETLKPTQFKMKKGYVLVFLTFKDLETLLKLSKKKGLRSPLYKTMPTNLIETIQMRGIDLKAEISTLCLLPVVHHGGKAKDFVNPYFIDDLRLVSGSA